MTQGTNNDLAFSNKYLVQLAGSEEDIKRAQQLRFEVFNMELGEGLATSYKDKLDADPYDAQCHHLLVIERDCGKVIGTYRMQSYEMSKKNKGFYTNCEYDLNDIPDCVLENSVEVGRACIDRNHRNGRVLYLLWRGLAQYMNQMHARYLFGCCSVTSQDAMEAWKVMGFLQQQNYLHTSIRVDTRPKFRCDEVELTPNACKDVVLPQLFRLYMDLGAKVCGPPAMDRDFKTIDYLVLLDIESLDERTKLLFFK